MLDRRSLLAALAALPTTFSARSARAAEPGLLRIGYQKNGILVVAKQQGIIERRLEPLGHTVRWVEFSFGPPLLEALSLDGIDFGQTGDAPPIFAQAARSNLVYAAAQEAGGSGIAILLPKGSGIRSLAELKGKRVAFAKASSAHNLTIAALETVGLTYADIEPVTLAPADAAAAFARGSIDAWTIWDPFQAAAERATGARVLTDGQGIAPNRQFYLSRRGFTDASPEVVSAVLKAIGEVDAWAEGHAESVAAELAPSVGIPAPVLSVALGRLSYGVAPLDAAVIADQQKVADAFHGLGLLPKPIRVADAVWTPPERRAEAQGANR